MRKTLLSFLLSLSLVCIYAQNHHYQFTADFSFKEIKLDGAKKLTMGKLVFENNPLSLRYDISFPEQEIMFLTDSLTYSFYHDSLKVISTPYAKIDFSVYNLVLTNALSDFGLKEKGFQMEDTYEENDRIITIWLHAQSNQKVVITKYNGLVETTLLYDHLGNMVFKQVYSDYEQIGRFQFPIKILELTYFGEQVIKKLTTLRNIQLATKIDENSNTYFLEHTILPRLKSAGESGDE